MSIWTHVNATFRVDAFRFNNTPHPNWTEIFGEELHYNWDWDDKRTDEEREADYKRYDEFWEKYNKNPLSCMPTGSEGSLTSNVSINPDTSCMAAYVVNIFGDLRDYEYDDCEKYLEPWFKQSCERLNLRQAICEYNCYPLHVVLVWSGEDVKRVEVPVDE